jgi:hypothetical protein
MAVGVFGIGCALVMFNWQATHPRVIEELTLGGLALLAGGMLCHEVRR